MLTIWFINLYRLLLSSNLPRMIKKLAMNKDQSQSPTKPWWDQKQPVCKVFTWKIHSPRGQKRKLAFLRLVWLASIFLMKGKLPNLPKYVLVCLRSQVMLDLRNVKFAIFDPSSHFVVFFKFISSEKATKFCEIFTLLLSYVKKVKILQNFWAFSEYRNFIKKL